MAIATMNGRKNISEKRHIIVKLWLIQFIIIMIIMIHIEWDGICCGYWSRYSTLR